MDMFIEIETFALEFYKALPVPKILFPIPTWQNYCCTVHHRNRIQSYNGEFGVSQEPTCSRPLMRGVLRLTASASAIRLKGRGQFVL
jgi:hypothetical protein